MTSLGHASQVAPHVARAFFMLLLIAQPGCSQAVQKVTQRPWHQKLNWKAEEFFDDPQVIALCHAIEANDLDEIDRLVAAGADVNAQGKGKMTPLMWAYPDNKLARFRRLLEHGADPNVVFEDDFNVKGYRFRGNSVTHMACGTAFPGYFEAVFDHGGDPNLIKNGIISNQAPLFTVLKGAASNKRQKIETLIDLGANLNHMRGTGATPVEMAVGWGGQFDIALLLLKAGADYRVYGPDSNSRLIHAVVKAEHNLKYATQEQTEDYRKLVRWLEDHGESIEEARADIARWRSWSGTPAQKAALRRAEIAEREAREKAEREAKEKAERDAKHNAQQEVDDKDAANETDAEE